MPDKEQLLKIQKLKGAPFNYQYIKVLADEEAVKSGEIPVSKEITVDALQTTSFDPFSHHKPISKIIDFSKLAVVLKK